MPRTFDQRTLWLWTCSWVFCWRFSIYSLSLFVRYILINQCGCAAFQKGWRDSDLWTGTAACVSSERKGRWMHRRSTTLPHDWNFSRPHKTNTVSVRRLSPEMFFQCVLTLTKESPWERPRSMCLGNLIMHTDRLLCMRAHAHTPTHSGTHRHSLTLSTPFLATKRAHRMQIKPVKERTGGSHTNLLKAFLSSLWATQKSKSGKHQTDSSRGEWLH